MSDLLESKDNALRVCGKALSCALCVFIAGAINVPRVTAGDIPKVPHLMAADADQLPVPIDQQPLTVADPIPPNIVLMLDDSGSMMWDIMPDSKTLKPLTQARLKDASINGVYYNPSVLYTPPPKADGTPYPSHMFAATPANGFDSPHTRPVVDLSRYDGEYDSSKSVSMNGNYPKANSKINYSIAISTAHESEADAVAGSFVAPDDCPAGTKPSEHEDKYCYYATDPYPSHFEYYNTVSSGTWYVSKCNKPGYVYNLKDNMCLRKDNVTIVRSCPDDVNKLGTTRVRYNIKKDICVNYAYFFFTYFVGGVQHYVGKPGTCVEAGLDADVCVDISQTAPTDPSVKEGMSGADVLQNVANWFTYYHTRMLMAKSGLMMAFDELDPDYRFGFGSINANANNKIPTAPSPFVFDDHMTNGGNKNNKIAAVQPFGVAADAESQRRQFWNWIAAEHGKGNTPLRHSLNAVGSYYEGDQAWETMASDPESSTDKPLACRLSYVILTTDGFWNDEVPDVGNQDGESGSSIPNPDPDKNSFQYDPARPYSDGVDDTLADVAMKYWKRDIQPDISNEVPTSPGDPAFWQHMTTFTIGMGFQPTGVTPADTEVDQIFEWAESGDAPENFAWPTPVKDKISTIADLAHAAVNGHGGFYSATSPQAFSKGLGAALKRIASLKGSGSSLSASSAKLGNEVYQSLYHTGDWSGSLYAFKLDQDGNLAADSAWSAEARMPAYDKRNIHTYNPDNSGSDADVTFEYDNLSDDEKAALGDDTDMQTQMVQYLRGKTSKKNDESAKKDDWRTLPDLGDIVDSQPIYVGAPDPDLYSDAGIDFKGSKDYKDFASSDSPDGNKDVTPVLYVAANDGMLHGFNANTGTETYAYLPAAVILHGSETGDHHISQLADPDYGYQNGGVPHQFFNDGQLTVADVYMGGNWKAVLVGTTGRGHAKAVYALDVTNPKDVRLLWEKSAYSDCDKCAYIGQMTSKPIIAQVANGEWAVLMGNGYNSEKNQAALLQFDLDDGDLHVHRAGDDDDNGLSGPAIWIANSTNNISTVAYAGDLEGHVWSFTLNHDGDQTADSSGHKLFRAEDADGKAQPITSALAVQRDASTGKRWVFFGTGRYLASSDIKNGVSKTQTWYGLIVADKNGEEVKAHDRDHLARRKIRGQGTDSNGDKARAISKASEADPLGEDPGWYIDLTDAGERMVVANQFHGHLLYGTSIIPTATDPCDPTGSGWVMAIDPFTGTNPAWQVFGSTLTTGDDDDRITRNTGGIHFGSMPNAPIFVGGHMLNSTSSGDVTNRELTPLEGGHGKSQRISWREVVSD
jgi:type IV pilus assembly protein PilY1